MRKALLLLALAAPAAAQVPFCAQLQAITQEPAVAAAHWGVSVTTLAGASLCAVNDAQLFRPASNAKLFTAAAAFALLGPAHTSETRVTGQLDPATGVVTGDLTLVGGGDPGFGSNDLPYTPGHAPRAASQDLEDLARRLASAGVRSVTGDLVGDDTFFPYEPYAQSVAQDDLVYGFGAPISALSIADNQLRLTVAPGKPPLLEQPIPFYTVESEVIPRPAKTPSGVGFERTGRTLRIYGTLAADATPDVEEIAIDDPALFAAQLFRSVLATHGITVAGEVRALHRRPNDGSAFLARLRAPADKRLFGEPFDRLEAAPILSRTAPPLAAHTSATLADDLVFTLKTSQNLHAELIFHALGRCCVSSNDGSILASARVVRAFLLHAGLPENDFLFYDGSGLSDHDLITPRATTTLLAYASTQPWFAAYKTTLPIGGTDGTLTNRFPGPLKGKVFAKTGTLGESRALSGFVTAASGRTVIFSILVDNHLPGSVADRTATDRMVELIASSN